MFYILVNGMSCQYTYNGPNTSYLPLTLFLCALLTLAFRISLNLIYAKLFLLFRFILVSLIDTIFKSGMFDFNLN